ncbi:unnamed protein product [Durusdinium trenchii]|uniref:Uncharacterized protein n=1 Tax=Durusdinium trenchii TaxID=1381693 RepID=A0ABP0KWT4_9DINO
MAAMTEMPMRSTLSNGSNSSLGSTISSSSTVRSEPRQLLLLLSSRRVETALRSAQDQLKMKMNKDSLSLGKLLKIIAEVHALWKLRDLWGSKPDESWGVFLDRLSQTLGPGCRSVALLQVEDWRAVKDLCTGSSTELLSDLIDAALCFHHSPTPLQVLRLSTVLDRLR